MDHINVANVVAGTEVNLHKRDLALQLLCTYVDHRTGPALKQGDSGGFCEEMLEALDEALTACKFANVPPSKILVSMMLYHPEEEVTVKDLIRVVNQTRDRILTAAGVKASS